MCGIGGIFRLGQQRYSDLAHHLGVINQLQAHRGPDGQGVWTHAKAFVGFAHRRLSIIDVATGAQPMTDRFGNTITYNGEIYNFVELRQKLSGYEFHTTSDTEVILAAYHKWGVDCVSHLRGMFAFAIWDESQQQLFCARDRFGIKPFYYTLQEGTLFFASETKSLMPFLPEIKTDMDALHDYLVFQMCLGDKTLFEGVRSLPPAHRMVIKNGVTMISKYWEVYYNLDYEHTPKYFQDKLQDLIGESVHLHTRSDVPIGAYVSGGVDSGIIASVAAKDKGHGEVLGFNGKFAMGHEYDESSYARDLAKKSGITLHEVAITAQDFMSSIENVIYHLDYPVAGPGSFPQYHVSKLAAQHRKVVLGGQGGDEIFGGYTRYLIAYFEQCIKAAIDGTTHNGNFIVTYESIIPNLQALKNYKPLLKEFWREGLFDDLDKRYYRLVNRAPSLGGEVVWSEFGEYSPYVAFTELFNGKNVGKESYFDKMTHFDFKTLLPALLHVEDRMSMAHSVESRVPFVDHAIVEFAATMPADIKFKDGTLKKVLTSAMAHELPESILSRKDKMGFPVPLNEWMKGEVKGFIRDVFAGEKARQRPYFNQKELLKGLNEESKFGRKVWGLMCLEIWHQQFHDKAHEFKSLLKQDQCVNV